jgi:hypothetical protein
MNLLVLADDEGVRHDLTAQPVDLVLAVGDDLSGLLLCVGGSQREAVAPTLPVGSLSVPAAAATVIAATVIAAAVIASPMVAATVIASVIAAIITPPESEAERY